MDEEAEPARLNRGVPWRGDHPCPFAPITIEYFSNVEGRLLVVKVVSALLTRTSHRLSRSHGSVIEMPHLGRHAQEYGDLRASPKQTCLPCPSATVIDSQSMVDLAIAEFGRAKVSCWTTSRDRLWGRHGVQGKPAAVMHFRMQAQGPDDCRLSDFELDLDFPVPGSQDINDTTNKPQHYDCATRLGHKLDVCLIDHPAPSCVEGTASAEAANLPEGANLQVGTSFAESGAPPILPPQVVRRSRTWKLRSSAISDKESGLPRTARWTLEANQDSHHVQSRTFHGGIAICHPGQPFEMTCQVRGKVTKPGGLRFKFSNEHHKPRVWRIVPQTSDEDIKQHIDQLEAEMVERNSQLVVAGMLARKYWR